MYFYLLWLFTFNDSELHNKIFAFLGDINYLKLYIKSGKSLIQAKQDYFVFEIRCNVEISKGLD